MSKISDRIEEHERRLAAYRRILDAQPMATNNTERASRHDVEAFLRLRIANIEEAIARLKALKARVG